MSERQGSSGHERPRIKARAPINNLTIHNIKAVCILVYCGYLHPIPEFDFITAFGEVLHL